MCAILQLVSALSNPRPTVASSPVKLFGFTSGAVGLGSNEFGSDGKASPSAILNEEA